MINVLAGKTAWLIEPLFPNDTFFKLKQPPDMSSSVLGSRSHLFLACKAVYYTAQFGLDFWVFWLCYWNESYWAILSCSTVYYAALKVVLTFQFVDNILKCDHSNESYWAVLSCGIVYYSEQAKVFLTFHFLTSVDEILKCDFNWKLLSGTFLLYCLLRCTR